MSYKSLLTCTDADGDPDGGLPPPSGSRVASTRI